MLSKSSNAMEAVQTLNKMDIKAGKVVALIVTATCTYAPGQYVGYHTTAPIGGKMYHIAPWVEGPLFHLGPLSNSCFCYMFLSHVFFATFEIRGPNEEIRFNQCGFNLICLADVTAESDDMSM